MLEEFHIKLPDLPQTALEEAWHVYQIYNHRKQPQQVEQPHKKNGNRIVLTYFILDTNETQTINGLIQHVQIYKCIWFLSKMTE